MVTPQSILSKANNYMMPSVEDYLAARCLLLSNIFVGLTLGHEAVEKVMKALLILEDVVYPKSCHKLVTLAKLLVDKNSVKYEFLCHETEFIGRLEKHYAWRYYDGKPKERSQNKSPSELHEIDSVYLVLYKCYVDFLPKEHKFGNFLASYLFAPGLIEYTNWAELLLADNEVLKGCVREWEKEFIKWYTKPPIHHVTEPVL